MKNLFTLSILFLAGLAYSQCPSGSVMLSTQAEVDDFVATYPNCTQIDGDLSIGSSFTPPSTDPLDLSGLNALVEVTGSLFITKTDGADEEGNPIPGSLEGLENIESVENLYIGGNPDATFSEMHYYESLAPLNGLTGQIGDLFITSISLETELPTFENLTSMTYYRQDRVLGITSSPTFPNLNHLGDLTIAGSPIPFEDSLFTTVVIPPLLDSIANFGFPFGGLFIFDTWNVTEFQGGENLSYLAQAFFSNNFSLSDLSALSNVTTIGFGGLSITSGNPEIFDSFQSLQSIEPGSEVNLTFFIDPEDCMQVSEELVIGLSSQVPGNEISSFPLSISANCVETVAITGNFAKLTGLDIATDATTITGFASLDSITETRLEIYTPNISQLPEFENLVHVEDDILLGINSGDWLLEDLSGLSALASVGGDLRIGLGGSTGGAFFTSLTGLENLTTVGGRVRINRLEALTEASALDNLVSAGGLRFERLESLTNPPAMAGLASVGEIRVDETGLLSLPEFPSLSSMVGDLRVEDNTALTAIDGFVSLEELTGNITIEGNPQLGAVELAEDLVFDGELTLTGNASLEDCGMSPSICNIISQASVFSINQNGDGCMTGGEVLETCLLSATNMTNKIEVTIGMGMEDIWLRSTSAIGPVVIEMVSMDGRRIFSEIRNLPSGEMRLAIPDVAEGIYVISLRGEELYQTEKVFMK